MSETIKTVHDAYLWAVKCLEGTKQSRLITQLLICEALGIDKQDLYIHFDDLIDTATYAKFKKTVLRRKKGEPVQYILGTAAFRNIELDVRPGVLIPRPETEILVDVVLDYLKNINCIQPLIADLCCGSGNVSISLANELKNCHIYATDICDTACKIAEKNVAKYDYTNKIDIINTDLFNGIMQEFPRSIGNLNVVVSNPPYVPSSYLQDLESQVKDFEPALALDGGSDGLDFFRRIAKFASYALLPGGLLAVEIFELSFKDAKKIAKSFGFIDVETKYDLNYKQRVLVAHRS